MDEADRAQKRMEQELELMLSHMPKSEPLPYTGVCHWCGEDVPEGKLYCDGDCASDHSKYGERR